MKYLGVSLIPVVRCSSPLCMLLSFFVASISLSTSHVGVCLGPRGSFPSETLVLPGGAGQSEHSPSPPSVSPSSMSSGPSPFSPTCGAGLAAEDTVYEEVDQRAEDTGNMLCAWLLPEQVTLRDNRETQVERAGRSLLTSVPGGC